MRVKKEEMEMAEQQDSAKRDSGMPGGGAGRVDEVGHTPIFPASGPLPDEDLPTQGMASWGQGERGAEGYNDSGTSELSQVDGEVVGGWTDEDEESVVAERGAAGKA